MVTLRPGQRVHNIPGIGVQTSRRAVASAAWWLAGGAPTPIAVYQPKGAADLATSYVNLVTPGTYNAAPGVAPTLDASGWVFVAASSQYLVTGITPISGYGVLVRLSNVSNGGCAIGSYKYVAPTGGLAIFPNVNSKVYYYGGNEASVSPAATGSAVLAIAGTNVFRNGADEGDVNGTLPAGVGQIMIGAAGTQSNAPQTGTLLSGNIQAVAIWDTSTGHATWMPACMAACALI